MGKKKFTERVLLNIYIAIKYKIESEKNIFSELPDWQNKQDRIKEFKDRFAQILEAYDKRNDYFKNNS